VKKKWSPLSLSFQAKSFLYKTQLFFFTIESPIPEELSSFCNLEKISNIFDDTLEYLSVIFI
jgi:hypothetical protein